MSKDVMRRFLKSVALFADLPDADLDTLVAAARSVSFKKGARIFEEGAAADCCFVMTSGRARVVLAGNSGTEILLQIVTPPALIGEIALLDKSTRSAALIAAEPCHLLRIPAAAFDALRSHPAFEQRLVAAIVSILRGSEDRVRMISSFPAINRVAWCLGRIALHGGRREGAAIVFPKPPQNDLAEMAGCTRETVSRVLQALRQKKYVSWSASEMRIDVDAMQRYLTTELTVPERAGSRSNEAPTLRA